MDELIASNCRPLPLSITRTKKSIFSSSKSASHICRLANACHVRLQLQAERKLHFSGRWKILPYVTDFLGYTLLPWDLKTSRPKRS